MTRRYRSWAIATVLAMLLAACGGDEGAEDEAPTSTTATQAGVSEDTEPDDSTDTESTTTTLTEASEEDPPATGSGTAVLTLGGTTYEFAGLTCYYDEAAAEAVGDDDTTFAAIARDGDSALLLAIGTRVGLELFEVLYQTGGPEWWSMVSNEVDPSHIVENGQISAEGEFEEARDGAETGTVEQGTVEASCG